jgi:hypothetical protein
MPKKWVKSHYRRGGQVKGHYKSVPGSCVIQCVALISVLVVLFVVMLSVVH